MEGPPPARPRTFGPGALAIVAVCALAFFGPMKPGADSDSWWHLATGQLIIEQGSIPDTDPFSWTAPDHHWVVQEWGSEIIFAAVHSAAGPAGLLVLEGVLIGATALVLLRILRRMTSEPLVIAGVLLVAVALSTLLWTVRPHLFTLLLFALTLDLLTANEGNWKKTRWLIPITLLWVNLHAAFIVGLVLIGIFATVRSLTKRGHHLWIVLGACVVAGCFNPEGPPIYLHPLRVVGASRRVLEWMPPDLHDPASFIFAVTALGTFVLLTIRRRSPAPELLAAAALFSLAAFGAMRNIPLAGIALAPCLAVGLGGLIRHDERAQAATESKVLRATAGALVVAGLASAFINIYGASEAELFRESKFPRRAVEVLNGLPQGRLVNTWAWGGYLIYRAPRFPVSFDGRNDMYGPELVADQLMLEDLSPGWDKFLDDNEVRYVLWQRARPLAEALRLDEGWRLVYEDRLAVLFERQGY